MAKRYELKDLRGVIPALVTCFDENGAFDEERQRGVVRFLLDRKVSGLYLTGSTGESFMMSPQERMKVVETVVDEVRGAVPLMAHVGSISTRLSIELAQQAEAAGVDAISSVPPFYWKFTDDEIFDYYRELTSSVGLPMVIYNLALAGLVGYGLIKRIAAIDGVEGIKYTASTHDEIMRIKEEIGPDFLVYSGADQMAMSGLMFGADGIIGSFYNMMPELFMRLYDAVQVGDLKSARELQAQANAVIAYSHSYSYVSVIKRSMKWAGADGGYCRRPFAPISSKDEEGLRQGLRQIRDKLGIKDVAVFDAL